ERRRQREVAVLGGLGGGPQRRVEAQGERGEPAQRHQNEEGVQHHPGRPRRPPFAPRYRPGGGGRRGDGGGRRRGGHRPSSRMIRNMYVTMKPRQITRRITASAEPNPIRLASPTMLSKISTESSSRPLRPLLTT